MAKPKVLQDIGDTSALATASKDLVGAINEVFQNANNGKQVVATTVGLPLQATDTFSKMGTDIEKIKTDFANAINSKKALADGYVPPDLGNATADKVLTGSTFSSSVGENIAGTMANRGSVGVQKLTTQNQIFNILNGFHDGNGQVKAEISNLIAGNIAKGINVGGVVGTFEGGKRIANGTGSSEGGSIFTVTSLSFRPSIVIIHFNKYDGSGSGDSMKTKVSGIYGNFFSANFNSIKTNALVDRNENLVGANAVIDNNEITLNSNGFSTNIMSDGVSRVVFWIAIE